jgi:dihydroorotase
MRYVKVIDPHVHLRGTEYDIDFRRMAFEDAAACGVAHIIEQPNPTPKLIDTRTTSMCLEMTRGVRGAVGHSIHIGITNDIEQVRKAFEAVMRNECGLVSDKMFYVNSTGNMGILDHDYQRRVWKMAAEMGYRGVRPAHLEDEELFDKTNTFNPDYPVSHTFFQNEESEVIQLERQLRNAHDAKFKGTFYACHLSSPDSVDLVGSFKKEHSDLPFDIVIEATWHHLFLNWHDYETHGNRVKMNPPLRPSDSQERLLTYLLQGKIDIIGSDHAPHPLERKDDPKKPASGIPALPFIPKGIELLRQKGIDGQLLEDITFNNANRIFRLGLVKELADVRYDPSIWSRYGWNPFSRVDGSR